MAIKRAAQLHQTRPVNKLQIKYEFVMPIFLKSTFTSLIGAYPLNPLHFYVAHFKFN